MNVKKKNQKKEKVHILNWNNWQKYIEKQILEIKKTTAKTFQSYSLMFSPSRVWQSLASSAWSSEWTLIHYKFLWGNLNLKYNTGTLNNIQPWTKNQSWKLDVLHILLYIVPPIEGPQLQFLAKNNPKFESPHHIQSVKENRIIN